MTIVKKNFGWELEKVFLAFAVHFFKTEGRHKQLEFAFISARNCIISPKVYDFKTTL